MKKILQKITGIFTSGTKKTHHPDKEPSSSQIATKELEKIPETGSSAQENHSSPHIEVGYGLSIGRQRTHNEDAFFTLTTMFSFNESEIPFGLYIVADGMGGHRNGEVASELAIRTVAGSILKEIYCPIMGLNPEPGELSFREVFHDSIEKANDEIIRNSYGGGTTITAILIVGEQMTIAHVGDSRVYKIDPQGNLSALTRDHSLVKRLQELGQITPEEAAVHPQRNVLYRALGQGEPFEPEIISTQRPKTGSLLVCSDGLWSIVEGEVLEEIVNSGGSAQEIADQLIDAANQAGGPDNISVVFITINNDR
jgi:PPM family protein phosphatase